MKLEAYRKIQATRSQGSNICKILGMKRNSLWPLRDNYCFINFE